MPHAPNRPGSSQDARQAALAALGLDRRRLAVMAALTHPELHGGTIVSETAHAFWVDLLALLDAPGSRKGARKRTGKSRRQARPAKAPASAAYAGLNDEVSDLWMAG